MKKWQSSHFRFSRFYPKRAPKGIFLSCLHQYNYVAKYYTIIFYINASINYSIKIYFCSLTLNINSNGCLSLLTCLFRNLRARKLDENFWDTAFLLHCPGENGTTKKTKSPRSDQWMNVSKSEGQQVSSEYVDGKNESETFWMPGFLLPILREV